MPLTSSEASTRVRVRDRIAQYLPEMRAIRHDIHAHPEIGFEEHRTSLLVADLLERWGYEVCRQIGVTGVVGTLRRGNGKVSIGIRADMDALPIEEATALAYASTSPGVMHACGHDGHTTTLLTAARYLAEHGEFNGTLHVIFQPAEENLGGAHRMVEDGLFTRFPCDAIFGLHNMPGVPAGRLCFLEGPAMASCDTAVVRLIGKGGHGAAPHLTADPIVAAASLVMALQTVVSRNVAPLDTAVVSVGSIHGGSASNVIPDHVELQVTIRAFSSNVRDLLERRITALVAAQAESFGVRAHLDYERGYPVLVNHIKQTRLARDVAETTYGTEAIATDFAPIAASEDFAYMLEQVPGCYLFVGNGDSASLHNPRYDFNDDIIPVAAEYWVALTQQLLV